ncbi:MAG: hypothetical protein ACOCQ4_02485, partial [bacterium]
MYFSTNIKHLGDGGTGYTYLVIMVLTSLALFIISGRYYVIFQIKKSFLLLILFFGYIVIKFFIDIDSMSLIKQYTIGSTGGILFSFSLGLILSFVISDLYITMQKNRFYARFASNMMIAYSWVILLFILQLYKYNLAHIRTDRFLVAHVKGVYQRPGDMLFMQVIILVTISALLYIHKTNSSGRLPFYLANIAIIPSILLSILLSQLIGSNSGAVASAGFFILLVSYFFIAKKITPIRSIKINSILLGWLGRRLTKGVLISSLFFITAAFALMRYFSISLSNLRIFSYGTGKISSVGTRMDILTNNFLTHFAYNPFFGNAQVEIETTGGGTYVHSLLSILTHTGIVGLIFFMVFLFAIYNDITKNTSNNISLYTNKHYSL